MNKYDKKHLQNLEALDRLIKRIMLKAAEDAARIGARIDEQLKQEELFSFDDYPSVKPEVERLLKKLEEQLEVAIVNGVDSAWTLSNNKNDELSRRVFGDNVGELSQTDYNRYFSNNNEAREAFKQRKTEGLNLSDRVWNCTKDFKAQIELGLDVGIRNGTSAVDRTQELKQWLVHPDKLFRRVRDENGLLQLSEKAKAFHPGRGVYRSSYMNARRLAATETNIAYRTADHLRWQQMDFVVGIEICLSNNHTIRLQPGETTDDPKQLHKDGTPKANAVRPLHDICNELKGRYPKTFKFTSWHPHCRCYAVSILKTDEELAKDNERILNGEEPTEGSVNEVKDVPEGFKKWLEENEERAKRNYSVPYFLSDNKDFLPKEYLNLYSMKKPYDTYAEHEAAMNFNKRNAKFTPEQRLNNKELSEALPVIQGKVMNFKEADRGHINPCYTDSDAEKNGYWHNCQTCTVGYELRRRGFPVEAMPNKNWEILKFYSDNKLTENDRFLNLDGSRPIKKRPLHLSDTIKAKTEFIEESTKDTGRYELYFEWKVKPGEPRSAHVLIVERQKDGNLLWFDPQSGRYGSSAEFKAYLKKAIPIKTSVLRIDDKIINPKFAERFKKASK